MAGYSIPIFPLFSFHKRQGYLMLFFGYSPLIFIFNHLGHEFTLKRLFHIMEHAWCGPHIQLSVALSGNTSQLFLILGKYCHVIEIHSRNKFFQVNCKKKSMKLNL
eukprot:TRINITY_DN10144_c0_g5_i1.p1 TRINITY_DN10144_c0_g5~~TRINITY_DN10144_c0_g5_i1.p1  ORF type:complete len:106 (-),score=1.36 TRINITY_DN10144_c0_g5_i1:337-654(-)